MTDAYEGSDDFEWDLEKAMSAFDDPFSLVIPDPDHSEWEERLILIGLSDHQRLLVVIYTEREDSLRLISARATNPAEKRKYEEEPNNGF